MKSIVNSGLGSILEVEVGGKNNPELGEPLRLEGNVVGIFDGDYRSEGPMYTGLVKSFGQTAVLYVYGIEIIVTTHNLQILDRMQFAAFGINPELKKVVALKSMQHFRAAFEQLAAEVIVYDSGALARPRRSTLLFQNVRMPVCPLDKILR